MRLQLVAPTKRKDSANLQFEQRLPVDLRERLERMTLEFPRGDDIVPITIFDKTRSIRYSLGTADRVEAKRRQAEAIAYLEGVYGNLRANVPVSLTCILDLVEMRRRFPNFQDVMIMRKPTVVEALKK